MKKYTFIILATLFLISCSDGLTLISAVKQKIVPGVPTVNSYTNYVVTFLVKNETNINVDSVKIYDNSKCYLVKHLLKKEKSPSYTNTITESGTYVLELPLRGKNKIERSNCAESASEVTIFYTEGKSSKSLTINEFTEERKTMR